MDNTFVDFDFSCTEQEPLDAANDPFGGVNFDDPLDGADICFDLPPQQLTPDRTEFPATLPEQLEEPVPSILEPSVGIYSEQPQYVNLDQVSSIPQQQTSFISQDYVPTNDTGITWTVVEKQILDSLPKPNELAYNLPLYDPQGYTSLPPMTTQFSTQPMFPPQHPINLGYQPPYVPQPQHQPWADPPVPRPPLDNSRSSRIPSRSPNRTDGTMPSRFPLSPKSITTNSPPLKRPEKNHNGELLRNDKIPRVTHRNKGPEAVEPELYYGPSPPKPQPWGPKNDKGEYLFTYTEKGELAPGKFFTQKQMRYYLMGPKRGEPFEAPRRLKGVKAKHGLRRQGLILWIGWPAAMANSRYPRGGESTKCRFADCQYSQTIKVGEPWVIFDERQNHDGEVIDPFHNAGYCHLYCLEFHFDIIELSNHVEIKPDYRKFKREMHDYFSLSNKLPQIQTEVAAWWQREIRARRKARARGEKRKRDRPSSLDQVLVNYKLSQEPKAQTINRQKRCGIDMSKHRNDPELKRKLQVFKKHDLLDESGNPIQDADAQLEAIEHANKRQRRGSKAAPVPVYDPVHLPTPPPPGFNKQLISTFGVNAIQYGSTPPVYSETPNPYGHQVGVEQGYSNTTFVNIDHPMTRTGATQTIGVPEEMAGRKRGRDETAIEIVDISGEPLPKKTRLEDIPEQIDLRAENGVAPIPTNDLEPNYNTQFEMQDGLPVYNLDADNGATAEFDNNFNVEAHEPDLGNDLDDEALQEFYGAQEAAEEDGKPVGDTNDHLDGALTQAEPLPTHQEENLLNDNLDNLFVETEDREEDNQLNDELIDLFGDPEDRQSPPPASPRTGRSPSPLPSDPQCPTNGV